MNDWPWFAPPLLGGILIGVASWGLWHLNGRVAGCSGILGGAISPGTDDRNWRVSFLCGLLAGGVLMQAFAPWTFPDTYPSSLPGLALSGLLVGFGTRLANGCTSGHGVCGISRLSVRSTSATVTFIFAGVMMVAFLRHAVGGFL